MTAPLHDATSLNKRSKELTDGVNELMNDFYYPLLIEDPISITALTNTFLECYYTKCSLDNAEKQLLIPAFAAGMGSNYIQRRKDIHIAVQYMIAYYNWLTLELSVIVASYL